MNDFPRPFVVVSKCLGFDHCRYNGEIIDDPFVRRLREFIEFKPVCAEMEIGLGVPRDPIRVVLVQGEMHLVQPSTGEDFSGPLGELLVKVGGTLARERYAAFNRGLAQEVEPQPTAP